MMRVFKSKWFSRFSRKEQLTDKMLVDAIKAAENGAVDADYGGGLIKQRIARKGEGKSGGFRTIIAYRKGDLAFFIYGFAKKDKDNLSEDELREYKKAAGILMGVDQTQITALIKAGVWTEISNGKSENI